MPTRTIHREARRFEDDLARDLGGRRVPLSGAGMVKADVRKAAAYHWDANGSPVRSSALAFRVEAKTTWHMVFSFRSADWTDLVRAAASAGEHPIFAIRFLSACDAIAIARSGLMAETGVRIDELPWLSMTKSRVLRPDTVGKLALGAPADQLVVLPYHTFLERIRSHDLYAPDEEEEQQHPHAPDARGRPRKR